MGGMTMSGNVTGTLSSHDDVQRWLTSAIVSGEVPDEIIDAHHLIQYLKHTGTRKLLTRARGADSTNNCLSAVSI